MKILLIISLLISGIMLSGCLGLTQVQKFSEHDAAPVPEWTPIVTPKYDETPSLRVTTEKSLTKYETFLVWLKTDATNKHPYFFDPSKVYEEQYVCSQYTRDFLKNATDAGFEVYAVLLTGGAKGQDAWHILAALVVDNNLYFVEPQKDIIFKKEDMLKAYGFEYAYFGREVYISRNDAELSQPVNYNTVIGLNGANFLYLK